MGTQNFDGINGASAPVGSNDSGGDGSPIAGEENVATDTWSAPFG